MKRYPINELRHRITFQTRTDTTDSQGGFTGSWSDLVTVWGRVEPVRSNAVNFAGRVQTQRTHTCVIRHRTDITTEMRMTFDSRTFQIKGTLRPDEKKFFLVMDLEENQGT